MVRSAEAIRVLNVVPDPRVGGPHVRVAQVARRLLQDGVETTVVVPSGPAPSFFADQGVSCRVLDFERPRRHRGLTHMAQYLTHLQRDIGLLASLAQESGADLVHVNGILTISALLAASRAHIPSLWHLNDTLLPAFLSRIIVRVGATVATRRTYSARAVWSHVAGGTQEDILYPPVDTSALEAHANLLSRTEVAVRHGFGLREPIIVCVGHVNRAKGHAYLIEASRLLHEQGTPVQLLIVGAQVDQELWATLQRQAAALPGRVAFAGGQSNAAAYAAAADVFVLPSVSEAMPIALLEAMALGRPVVASAVGGVCEVVHSEINGLLVPPCDPAAIATAIHRLLTNAPLAARLGRAAATTVGARFTLDAAAAAHLRIYRQLLGLDSEGRPF